ncbi:MAG: DinB family protein [Chloroflexi bacterium]|nr:DinB family protein [Chloroflexota bacterium]
MDEQLVYAERIGSVLERLADTLDAIPPGAADARVVAVGSTPAIIAAHTHGAVQASVLGVACGQSVPRDRAQEFATAGADLAPLAAALRELATRVRDGLAALAPGALDERTTPPQHLMGAAPTRELARREALASVLPHAGEHLGELQLIRDILVEQAAGN